MDNDTGTGVTEVVEKTMSNAFRAVLVMVTGLMGAFCAAFTIVFTLRTIMNVAPAWLYRSLDQPFMALVCTVAYMATILAATLLTFMILTVASRLMKKVVITKWHISTCVVLLVMMVVLCCGVLPMFTEFIHL